MCSPFAILATDSLLAGTFAPQYTVELVTKNFSYVRASTGSPEAAPTMMAARRVIAKAERRGWRGKHLANVVKLFTS